MQTEAGSTTMTPVSEIVPQVVAEFTGKPGNFNSDMAALAAELNPAPVVPVQVETAPTQPEQPAAPATAPVTVPEKFKDADGNLDPAKLEKSTQDAQAALAKYLTTEKELRRKMQEVNGLKQSVPSVMNPTEPVAPASPFAAQLEADMAKYGAGEVLARLFEAAKETAKKEVLYDVQADREERLEIKSRNELNEIAKYDQGVLTPEGLDALARIRAERPWIEKAANPTSEAYKVYLADQVIKSRQSGTVLPTPTGLVAKAPPTPIGPAPRAVVQPVGPDINAMSEAEVNAHVAKMTPAQETAFWKSRGLRFK